MSKYLIIFLIFAGLMACEGEAVERNYHFSLEEYFKEQATQLARQEVLVEKTLIVAGEEEVNQFSYSTVEDWQKEFGPFIQADINKPAFQDAYNISVDSAGETVVKRFVAKEQDTPTQLLVLHMVQDSIARIEISLKEDNPAYTITKKMVYIPREKYTIEAHQEIVLSEDKSFKIIAVVQ